MQELHDVKDDSRLNWPETTVVVKRSENNKAGDVISKSRWNYKCGSLLKDEKLLKSVQI